MRIIQSLKQILAHSSSRRCRVRNRKFKGASGVIFSESRYYVNADGFIACRLGGAIVDIKDKS
nr:MAG TPA: Potyvirus P1 protease [Caudoviricetes sp.]